MKNTLILITALFMASSPGLAQNCFLNTVSNHTFEHNGILFSPLGSQVPNWEVISGTPDIYPHGSVFMFGQLGTNEVVGQQLCANLVSGKTYTVYVKARTSDRNFGKMVVEGQVIGGSSQIMLDTSGLTNANTFLEFSSTFTAIDNFTQILVYPVGVGGIMDIVVDSLAIVEEIEAQGTSQDIKSECGQSLTIGISDPGNSYDDVQWYAAGNQNLLGTGATLSIMPNDTTSYFAYKTHWNCADTCTSIDTVNITCSEPSGMYELSNSPWISSLGPNPANESALLKYTYPPAVQSAEILVQDMQGRIVQRHALNTQHEGSVTIDARSLAPGFYTCSMLADGKLMGARKLSVTRTR